MVIFFSCGDNSTAPDTDPKPLEFTTGPSQELSQLIDTAPGDFTWDYFSDNLFVSILNGPEWSGEIVLSSFQIENGEVVNRSTTEPYETNSEELSSGLSTEEMFPGLVYAPGQAWVTGKRWKQIDQWRKIKSWLKTDHWTPSEQWVPSSNWAPSEIEEIVLTEFNLSENETMIIVYTHLADGQNPPAIPGVSEVLTQPYGIILTQQEEPATGQLDVVTETGGENADDSYQVSINETTETIGANSSMVIPDLPVGDHEVELTDIADNCEVVAGDNPRTVTIEEGITKSTLFEVFCQEAFSGLAFTSFGDGNANIYTIAEDGSNMLQLTSNTAFDGQAAISPGGLKIAFTSERDGNREIYVMNIDGTNLTRLTNHAELDEHPAWSPDGSRIVFSSQRDGVDELYSMNSDGSDINQLTDNSFVDSKPDWSPDGEEIVFQRLENQDWDIWTINADGTNETNLTEQSGAVERSPEWSPDGSEIVFHTDKDGSNQIFRTGKDGSYLIKVTDNTSRDINPTWSPTGNRIAFESNRAGGSDIYIINRDGSSVNRLTMNDAFDESPNWSDVE